MKKILILTSLMAFLFGCATSPNLSIDRQNGMSLVEKRQIIHVSPTERHVVFSDTYTCKAIINVPDKTPKEIIERLVIIEIEKCRQQLQGGYQQQPEELHHDGALDEESNGDYDI